MRRTGSYILSGLSGVVVLLAMGSTAAATTFDSCTSAYNYGANTSTLYVSAAMNRAACDSAEVQKAEAALARAFKTQAIPAQNPEAFKRCFYEGLYTGYIHTLASERADCGQTLPLMSVAHASVSVFEAMYAALDVMTDAVVNQVFDGVFYAPSASAAACEDFLRVDASDLSSGFEEFVDSVCWNG
jgi:hypothetical protein